MSMCSYLPFGISIIPQNPLKVDDGNMEIRSEIKTFGVCTCIYHCYLLWRVAEFKFSTDTGTSLPL